MLWMFIVTCLGLYLIFRGVSRCSVQRHWAKLLGELDKERFTHQHWFEQPDNEPRLLGRLYGYVHARSEGIGLTTEQRHSFTLALLQELLLLANVQERISVYLDNDSPDFFHGWQEGKQAGSVEHSRWNADDKAFTNLFS